MKKILAESDWKMRQATVRFEDRLEEILYHANYDVECQGILPNVTIQATCTARESDKMPTIELAVNEIEANVFEVIPTMTFPTLTVGERDYADTIHYWLSEWEKVGKAITDLNTFEFDLSVYTED